MRHHPSDVDPTIRRYDETPEEERLLLGGFKIEAERTRALIRRFAPAPPAGILDVGGAAGAYAERRRALAEAARVLRRGDVLMAACITRWASLLDGLAHDHTWPTPPTRRS